MKSFTDNRLNPTINDRKRAMFSSKEFIASVNLNIESSARSFGSYAAFQTLIPGAGVRGVTAASLKSITLPMNFGTNLSVRTFNVTYTNVVAYPGNFTLPVGYYWYSIDQGTVTYATASAHPSSSNLIYYILNWFGGGIDSITVNPQNGTLNLTWNASTGSVLSTDVPAFFQMADTNGLAWIGNGNPIDLSGVKNIGIIIPDLAAQNSKSNVTPIPNYFCCVPVNAGFGTLLTYEPVREDICWLGGSKTISSLTVQVVDCATNTILPLVSDWSLCIRLYVKDEQLS